MSGAGLPRVLVLGTLLGQPMGGVRRHNAELLPRAARRLAEGGGSLSVMEGREPAPFPLPPPIERLASDVAARPPLLRWKQEGAAADRELALARGRGMPFDLVHTAHLPAPGRLKTPFTITIHDLRHLDPEHASLGKRTAARTLLARAMRRAAHVITVSETVRSDLIERFRVDPARVKVVPNAADHFDALPREPGRDAAILCVGHLEKRKNLDVLLRSVALDAGLPPIVLAGAAKDGEESRLAALARELGIEARVKFLGAFDEADLPRLYARAACVAVPSRIEGFGISALEAQRAGVPLAISRTPALLEVAGSETPAFALEDAADCARALRAALAASKETLERAAARAARFSWEGSARALVEAWCAAIA